MSVHAVSKDAALTCFVCECHSGASDLQVVTEVAQASEQCIYQADVYACYITNLVMEHIYMASAGMV